MVNKDQTQDCCKEVTSTPITPAQPSDGGREDDAHENDEGGVVVVLPDDQLTLVEIIDIGVADLPSGPLDKHPTNVGEEQAAVGRVRVFLGVGPAVVGAVATGPPLDGPLDGSGA